MTDSIEALKTFSADPSQFDLVITDQTMPGLTGIQLARELLALRRDIPIILFTGHSDTVTAGRGTSGRDQRIPHEALWEARAGRSDQAGTR